MAAAERLGPDAPAAGGAVAGAGRAQVRWVRCGYICVYLLRWFQLFHLSRPPACPSANPPASHEFKTPIPNIGIGDNENKSRNKNIKSNKPFLCTLAPSRPAAPCTRIRTADRSKPNPVRLHHCRLPALYPHYTRLKSISRIPNLPTPVRTEQTCHDPSSLNIIYHTLPSSLVVCSRADNPDLTHTPTTHVMQVTHSRRTSNVQ